MCALPSLHGPFVYGVLVWSLAACTAWHVEEGVTAKQLISTEHPSVIRLTRADSSHLVVGQPRIARGDSLLGVVNGLVLTVADSGFTQVAISKFSASRTLGLVATLSAIAAFVYANIPACSMYKVFNHRCPDSL
jgi:hypothetical protein